jgi:uncharacterized protein (TIGR03083 family)
MPSTDIDKAEMVSACYAALADSLEAAGPGAWDSPSPCEGWRVREVVAHVTMPVRYDEAAFMAELKAVDFDFTKLSNAVAARDAELAVETLLANLRDPALAAWTPPGGGVDGALSHAVIHGLDATTPLGRGGDLPADAVAEVLLGLTAGGGHHHFGQEIDGTRYEASDGDWSYGSGAVVRGAAADLVLHLSGRRLPAGRLEGLS